MRAEETHLVNKILRSKNYGATSKPSYGSEDAHQILCRDEEVGEFIKEFIFNTAIYESRNGSFFSLGALGASLKRCVE